jgi:hypothetical protein
MQSPDQLGDPDPTTKMPPTNDTRRIFDLSDRIAVVTGATGATGVLGSALAIGLARAGAKVGILGRRSEAAEATSAAIREFDGQSLCLTADARADNYRPHSHGAFRTPRRPGRNCYLACQRCGSLRHGSCRAGRWRFFGAWRVLKRGEMLYHLRKQPDWARDT